MGLVLKLHFRIARRAKLTCKLEAASNNCRRRHFFLAPPGSRQFLTKIKMQGSVQSGYQSNSFAITNNVHGSRELPRRRSTKISARVRRDQGAPARYRAK